MWEALEEPFSRTAVKGPRRTYSLELGSWTSVPESGSGHGLSKIFIDLLIRPALSGGMDWWRMEWPFSRVRKIFFRGRNFQGNP